MCIQWAVCYQNESIQAENLHCKQVLTGYRKITIYTLDDAVINYLNKSILWLNFNVSLQLWHKNVFYRTKIIINLQKQICIFLSDDKQKEHTTSIMLIINAQIQVNLPNLTTIIYFCESLLQQTQYNHTFYEYNGIVILK